MSEGIVAAGPEVVWKVLTTPALIKQYMFGAEVRSSWRTGSEITWDGRTTELELLQDNNKTVEEKEHSEKNWGMMLEGLKKLAEGI